MDINELIAKTLAVIPGDGLDATQIMVIVIAGLLLLALIIFLSKRLSRKRRARYIPLRYLFTKTEWHFAATLQAAIGSDYLMLGKVRIADLLAVERDPRLPKGEWLRAFSRISSKHIDYVLVDPRTGKVACCLELDDPSHNRRDRIERDIFVNAAFKQAGVPLLRIPTAKTYDAHELRQQIVGEASKHLKRKSGFSARNGGRYKKLA